MKKEEETVESQMISKLEIEYTTTILEMREATIVLPYFRFDKGKGDLWRREGRLVRVFMEKMK